MHPFTQKLQALANCRPLHAGAVPIVMSAVMTPLKWSAWEYAQQAHPDSVHHRRGYPEWFPYRLKQSRQLRPKWQNMSSAYERPAIVSDYLAEERCHNRILGPLPPSHEQLVHTCMSSFSVIPKRNQQNKWRLILELSSPEDHSINDGIKSEWCSLSYVSVDNIAQTILQLGQGTLLAKTDVKHAYRQIPVHPQDRPLLGMRWQGRVFVDGTLIFGLRSAPLIFSAGADVQEWIVQRRAISHRRFHLGGAASLRRMPAWSAHSYAN